MSAESRGAVCLHTYLSTAPPGFGKTRANPSLTVSSPAGVAKQCVGQLYVPGSSFTAVSCFTSTCLAQQPLCLKTRNAGQHQTYAVAQSFVTAHLFFPHGSRLTLQGHGKDADTERRAAMAPARSHVAAAADPLAA